MTVWISAEVSSEIGRELNKLYMQIEKSLNAYLKEIGYKNKDLDSLDVIAILRDDNYFNEIKKYRPKKRDTDIRLKIDYNEFKNGDEKKRKRLIYEMLLKAINFLKEEKGLSGFEPLEEYINKQIQTL